MATYNIQEAVSREVAITSKTTMMTNDTNQNMDVPEQATTVQKEKDPKASNQKKSTSRKADKKETPGYKLGNQSCTVKCFRCGKNVPTKLKVRPKTIGYVVSFISCLIFCPLVCLPCFIQGFLRFEHSCSDCGAYLGHYNGDFNDGLYSWD